VEFTPLAEKLAECYWPGPLTMVLDSRGLVPASVSAGLSTLAVRFPSHPGALAMLRAAERPIAAPSANLSGRPSPTLAGHVLEDLQGRIPLILDGGPVEIGLESTVVDARGEYPILLRPGKVTQDALKLLCGDCPAAGQADCARPASPGMKYRHYAPQGQLFLVKNWREAEALRHSLLQEEAPQPLLLLSEESSRELQRRGVPETQIISLGSEEEPADFAHNLFAALREAEHRGAGYIIGQSIPAIGLGAAVMNRYTKAASKK